MEPRNKIPNEVVKLDHCCLGLILTNRSGQQVGLTIIDEDDYKPPLSTYRWSLRPDGYAYNFQLGRLHHLIIGKPQRPLEVDHINQDRLDNRRSNLRIVDKQLQQLNRGLQSNNKTGEKNIHWSEERQKWVVQIQRKGEAKIQRRFATLSEAIQFRNLYTVVAKYL